MTFASGPFNIQKGKSVEFVVEFFDINGLTTTPPSATMTVAYTNTANSSQTDTVTLTPSGQFFTGTWSSTSASLGIATWTTVALPSSVQAATGQLRIINRGP